MIPWWRSKPPAAPRAPSCAALEATPCRSSGFIGGGQTFKFFFDAPPRKPLLWACLLAWASRDLYPVRLWFARALIPHPICCGRDTGLSRRTNRNLAVISQSDFFFLSLFPLLSANPLHFIPLYHPPSPFLHIFRYNYRGSFADVAALPSSCYPVFRRWVVMWGGIHSTDC